MVVSILVIYMKNYVHMILEKESMPIFIAINIENSKNNI